MDRLVAQTKDDLNSQFQFYIEKAEAGTEEGFLVISGVASSANVDHDGERMSTNALQQMANKINAEGVPLRIEHQKADDAIVGNVYSAEVTPRNQLMIKAKIIKDNAAGLMLHNALQSGMKMGFSVGGRVKRAYRELAEGAGKLVKTFYDIILDEVSVTPRPANYDSWANTYGAIAKSETLQTLLYRQFLVENPKLDYLAVIEKSIPEGAWEKVEIKNDTDKNMGKDIKKESSSSSSSSDEEVKAESSSSSSTEEKAESTSSTEKVGPSREYDSGTHTTMPEETKPSKYASMDYVDKKFGEVISLLKTIKKEIDNSETTQTTTNLDDKPQQQHNPDETTADPEAGKNRRKAVQATSEQQDGTLTTERETGGTAAMETTPKEQRNPDETTPDPETGKAMRSRTIKEVFSTDTEEQTKEESGSTDTDETKAESSSSSSSSSETTGSESSSTKNSYGAEYKLSSIAETLKKRGNMSSLDAFVAYVTKSIEDLKDGLSKSNKRVLGIEKAVVEQIKQDPEIQKSIKVWMDEPGQKKSVSLGVPYVVTKEGMRLRLVPDDVSFTKAVDKKVGFKRMWGESFGSKDFN